MLLRFPILLALAALSYAAEGTLKVRLAHHELPEVNLSGEGVLDWAHWGFRTAQSFTRKAGIEPLIGNYVPLVSGEPRRINDGVIFYRFRGGTGEGDSGGGTRTAIYTEGAGGGYEIKVAAGVRPRRLRLYTGVYSAESVLEARLSDGSAPPISDHALSAPPKELASGVYVVDFSAASPRQTLTVTLRLTKAHSLEGHAKSSWILDAATLSEPGVVNRPPSVRLSVDSTSIATPGPLGLAAEASDPDGSIARVDFFAGSRLIGSGHRSPYSILWTGLEPGVYTIEARAIDDRGAASASDPLQVHVRKSGGTGGAISATVSAVAPGLIDFSREGQLDWAYWIGPETVRKRGVPARIGPLRATGTGKLVPIHDSPAYCNWSGGSPVESGAAHSGGAALSPLSDGSGLEFDVPAGIDTHTLRVYVLVARGTGKLQAWLSDHSAPVFSDASVDQTQDGKAIGVYTLRYRAASPAQRLTLRWTLLKPNLPYENGIGIVAAALID